MYIHLHTISLKFVFTLYNLTNKSVMDKIKFIIEGNQIIVYAWR